MVFGGLGKPVNQRMQQRPIAQLSPILVYASIVTLVEHLYLRAVRIMMNVRAGSILQACLELFGLPSLGTACSHDITHILYKLCIPDKPFADVIVGPVKQANMVGNWYIMFPT